MSGPPAEQFKESISQLLYQIKYWSWKSSNNQFENALAIIQDFFDAKTIPDVRNGLKSLCDWSNLSYNERVTKYDVVIPFLILTPQAKNQHCANLFESITRVFSNIDILVEGVNVINKGEFEKNLLTLKGWKEANTKDLVVSLQALKKQLEYLYNYYSHMDTDKKSNVAECKSAIKQMEDAFVLDEHFEKLITTNIVTPLQKLLILPDYDWLCNMHICLMSLLYRFSLLFFIGPCCLNIDAIGCILLVKLLAGIGLWWFTPKLTALLYQSFVKKLLKECEGFKPIIYGSDIAEGCMFIQLMLLYSVLMFYIGFIVPIVLSINQTYPFGYYYYDVISALLILVFTIFGFLAPVMWFHTIGGITIYTKYIVMHDAVADYLLKLLRKTM